MYEVHTVVLQTYIETIKQLFKKYANEINAGNDKEAREANQASNMPSLKGCCQGALY